jgi:phosphodiesterase/alkaline phosphatase D-like protein
VLRSAARVIAIGSSILFAYLAWTVGPPVSPDGPGLERDVQYIFLGIGVVATLLSWRTPALGGLLLLLTGIVLGVVAAMRYSELTALLVALLYVIPAVLFLAAWASRRPAYVQFAALALVVGLMAYGGIEARARHERSFGPAHPASALQNEPYEDVEWVWSGGVTSTSATVNARVTTPGAPVRLLATPRGAGGQETALSSDEQVAGKDGLVSISIGGLQSNTTYAYAVEVDGQVDTLRTGTFTTFPSGPASFTFAVSSCARTGSNGAVFEAIAALDPLFYVISGDFHYENISKDDPGGFARAYRKSLTAPAASLLYREAPIAYVWDDHDFGGNNSDGTSAARDAATDAYRAYVPHYGLSDEKAIYQAFTVGRVRFVMTDTRSQRNLDRRPDGSKSLLGLEQLAWLKGELASAGDYGLVVWVNSVPWVGDFADSWGGYDEERREIADFIAARGSNNLLMLSGDAHMVAIDDGTNTDYATNGGAGFALLHAAALDRPGSVKGGPYSHGAYPGAGQFGVVEVQDDGARVSVRLSGRNWQGETLVEYYFTAGGVVGIP